MFEHALSKNPSLFLGISNDGVRKFNEHSSLFWKSKIEKGRTDLQEWPMFVNEKLFTNTLAYF
jgi:hypothetical protein